MPNLLVLIDSLRQRLNRWVLARAVGWWGAVVLATMLVLLAVDAVMRSPETAWRWLQFSILAVVAGWAARRYFVPLRSKPSRAAVARQIESQLPELRDRLSSAVLFLEAAERSQSANAPLYDSPQLRERVILETAAECADRDFSQLLSPRSLRRALFACGGLAVVFLGLAIAQPHLLGIGILRQLAPWRETQWPREHELYIEAENLRLARGETFQAAVLDQRGTLPRDLILQIRVPAGSATLENAREDLPLPWQPDRVAFRREDVQHDFEFRVIGGDDRVMPWTRVKVLEPARLEELALRIIPPAHTHWPAYRAEAPLLALPGSSLAITGRTTRPLTQASVEFAGQKFPLQIAADQRSFQFASAAEQVLPLTTSGKLHFEFTDTEGVVSSSDGYEVRLVPDQTPTIEWGSRAAEELLTPRGKWLVVASGRDDVAIERIELLVTSQDEESAKPSDPAEKQPLIQELYRRPPVKTKPAALEPGELEALRRGRWPEDRQPLKVFWHFPSPPPLGSRWQAVLRITDSAGQHADSEPRTLKVVSPEELSARMANRWSEILREFVSLSEAQQTVQRQVIESLDQPLQNAVRPEAWLPQQRQIARELTLPSAKIPRQLAVLEEEFAANQLQQTVSGQRLASIQSKLAALRRRELAALEQKLNQWEQAATAEQTTSEQRQQYLKDFIPLQAAVQQRLREIIDQLDQQSNWAQLERMLQALHQAQQALRGESVRNENLALGRTWEQLTAGEQAILRDLAQRQTALAEQLSVWQNTLGKLRLDAASGMLAADELRKLFLQRQPLELMRGASGNLSANRTGQATQQQAAIIGTLAEALELLRTGKSGKPPANTNPSKNEPANSKATPPAEQLAELRKLQERLTEFEQQQAKLNQQTAQFATRDPDQETPAKITAEALAKDQLTLHDQVMKLSSELGSEGPLMFQLIRIAEPMQVAATALRNSDAGNTTQLEQRVALDRLRLLLMAFSSRDIPPVKPEANKEAKENPQQAPKLKFTPRQVTELRLIRVLQLELTARTAAIADASKSITEPTAAEQRAAVQISEEQEKLREMLEQLIRETAPPTEAGNGNED